MIAAALGDFDISSGGIALGLFTGSTYALLAAGLVAAIEAVNAKTSLASLNERARAYGEQHGLALGAGSDDRQRVIVVGEVHSLGGDQLSAQVIDGGAHRVPPRSSSVQHLMPPPPSRSSDRSTRTGV